MSDRFNYNAHRDATFRSFGGIGAGKGGSGGEAIPEDLITESVAEGGSSFADMQLRAMAMGAVLTWIEEGSFTFQTLDELVIGVADLDGDFELTGEEKGVYEDLWPAVADAFLSLGADSDNVDEFLNDEADDSGEVLGNFLKSAMDNIKSEDDEIVSTFAEGGEGAIFETCEQEEGEEEDMVLEAAYKKVKVVRGGKVVVKKKRISGKVRLSAAQKAGLKKARRKSNTAAARLARKKSMRMRKNKGL